MDNQELDHLSLAITKALAYTENGGKPSVKGEKKGKSGELKSLFQYEPATWKAYSKAITGDANLPLTPANEALVTYGVVSKQVQKGLSEGKRPDEIATEVGSTWNSGDPQGASKGLMGTNREGVRYDVPAYAKKVVSYTNQFLGEPSPAQRQEVATSQPAQQAPAGQAPQIDPTANPLGNVQPNQQIAGAKPNPGLLS